MDGRALKIPVESKDWRPLGNIACTIVYQSTECKNVEQRKLYGTWRWCARNFPNSVQVRKRLWDNRAFVFWANPNEVSCSGIRGWRQTKLMACELSGVTRKSWWWIMILLYMVPFSNGPRIAFYQAFRDVIEVALLTKRLQLSTKRSPSKAEGEHIWPLREMAWQGGSTHVNVRFISRDRN